ncbi:DUF4405 domain-containing protein [Thermodesulfobacteriota bacterium]
MEKNKKKGFKWRGLATFLMVLGMFVEVISGIILYITPLGRFANWNNWTLWGLSKGEWGAVHTIFGYVLLIIIGMHLYFNWRVVVHFFWSKIKGSFNLKKEFAVSAVLTFLIFAGTLLHIPPFSTIMDLGISAKISWEKNTDVSPTRGYGRQELANASSRYNTGNNSTQYGNDEFKSQRRGNGRWARGQTTPQYNPIPNSDKRGIHNETTFEKLKGSDFARLGVMTSFSGTLVRIGDEWGLQSGGSVYEIHMGPEVYRASEGVVLKDGAQASITGFAYGTDISVARLETGGRSILLRDETGRPAWAGSRFSQGSFQ